MRTLRKHPGMTVNVPSLFNEFFNEDFSNYRSLGAFRTSVNIVENDQEYGLELVAPGFEKENFNLKIENNELIISAEVKTEEKEETKKYNRREFKVQSFKRSFSLPENEIDEQNVNANYVNGVLKVALPKREEAKPKAPQLIEIQ